jgi:hypothetical protein
MFEGMVDRALSRTQPDSAQVREKTGQPESAWDAKSLPSPFSAPKVGASSKS